jgi:hypothetical protein
MRRVVIMVLLAHCKDPPAVVDAASTTTTTTTSASTVSSATTAPTPTPTHTAELPPVPMDAGALACKLMSGPDKLSRPGPYAIVTRTGFVDFYGKDGDKPALAGSVRVEARPTAIASATAPASCAAAGTFVFCANASGEIHRFKTTPAIESDNFVARARPGRPISAALVNGHTVVAYLRDRMTSEGNMSEAYVESDDGTETRLSEDGSGATSVALAPRGEGAVAVYVDARRAMTPVHARTITVAPKLALGKDAVLFVAGTAETSTRPALAVKNKTAYALLPVAHDLAFGLATVKIDGEPATDAPTTWSDYPNGIDPAPIGGTASDALIVARVRPSAPKFGSPRVLELGTIDDKGAYAAYGIFPTTGSDVTNVSLASDGATGAAIAYTDASGGQAIRVSCPK